MRTIWKFTLPIQDDPLKITVPMGSSLMLIGNQESVLCAWYEIADALPLEDHWLVIVGTGHVIPKGADYKGSAIIAPFVWHVYEAQR